MAERIQVKPVGDDPESRTKLAEFQKRFAELSQEFHLAFVAQAGMENWEGGKSHPLARLVIMEIVPEDLPAIKENG